MLFRTGANFYPAPGLLLNWNEMVKRMVPSEKLLVMNLNEGWEPLCNFLDLPVPDEPLPRSNDAAAADRAAQEVAAKVARIWVGIIATSGVVAFGAWRLWRGR